MTNAQVVTDSRIVMDGTYYMVVVGYSELLKRDVFKILNKKWGVEAFEISNEKMALYLCSMLDKTHNKPIEDSIINATDADTLENFSATKSTVMN